MESLFNDLAAGKNSLSTFYEKNGARIEKAMQLTLNKIDTIG